MLNDAGPHGGEALTDVTVRIGDKGLQRDFSWVNRRGFSDDLVDRVFNTAHIKPEFVLMAGEVVSPSSKRRDYVEKREIYAGAGIPAYMIVDLNHADCPLVQHYVLDRYGFYCLTSSARPGEVLKIDTPFAFEFDPAVLIAGRRRPVR
jgi:Uma2 family endonuclease